MRSVYLDYAATTPMDERVIAAMLPYYREIFGNPSSLHYFGQQAEAALEQARRTTAVCLGASPEELIFTGGGTESDNLALRGVALQRRRLHSASHLLISPVEHHAVLHTARQLADEHGFELEFLPVDEYGFVSPRDVHARLRTTTALVSVVYAQNEIGTINPVSEIAALCRERGVPFHTDAVQAAAHLPIPRASDLADLLSIGAHKFYGPKGVGALFIRRGVAIQPVQTGGSQEGGLRAGTQNVAQIVGLAEAFRLTRLELDQHASRLVLLRDRIIQGVLEKVPNARLTGHPVMRLPNHASFVFEGVDGNTLLMLLDGAGFACSSGSACKSGSPKPSAVLEAIGLAPSWSLGSLRVTLGRTTGEDDVEGVLKVLPALVEKARRR